MINKDSKVVLDIVEGYLNRALGVKVVKPYDDSEYRDYFITSTGKTVEGVQSRWLHCRFRCEEPWQGYR